jgi:hypothetical protein
VLARRRARYFSRRDARDASADPAGLIKRQQGGRLERDNLAFFDDDFFLFVGRISHPITDDLISLKSKLLDYFILFFCRVGIECC